MKVKYIVWWCVLVLIFFGIWYRNGMIEIFYMVSRGIKPNFSKWVFNDLECTIDATEIWSEHVKIFFPESGEDISWFTYTAKLKNISYWDIEITHGLNISMKQSSDNTAYLVLPTLENTEKWRALLPQTLWQKISYPNNIIKHADEHITQSHIFFKTLPETAPDILSPYQMLDDTYPFQDRLADLPQIFIEYRKNNGPRQVVFCILPKISTSTEK